MFNVRTQRATLAPLAPLPRPIKEERRKSEERILTNSEVRGLWYSIFDPSDPKSRSEILAAVREEARKHIAASPNPTYGLGLGWGHPKINGLGEGFSLLALPRDTIVIPIMVSGLPYGAAVMSTMTAHGLRPEMVLLSYSKSMDGQFADGSKPQKIVYIPEDDANYLRANTGRTVLMVDNSMTTGETFVVVGNFLASMGFREIYRAYGTDLAHPARFYEEHRYEGYPKPMIISPHGQYPIGTPNGTPNGTKTYDIYHPIGINTHGQYPSGTKTYDLYPSGTKTYDIYPIGIKIHDKLYQIDTTIKKMLEENKIYDKYLSKEMSLFDASRDRGISGHMTTAWTNYDLKGLARQQAPSQVPQLQGSLSK